MNLVIYVVNICSLRHTSKVIRVFFSLKRLLRSEIRIYAISARHDRNQKQYRLTCAVGAYISKMAPKKSRESFGCKIKNKHDSV